MMYTCWLRSLLILFGLVALGGSFARADDRNNGHLLGVVSDANGAALPAFANLPLYFIANKGQVNQKALFYAKTSDYTLWLTTEGLVFDSTKRTQSASSPNSTTLNPKNISSEETYRYDRAFSRLIFTDIATKPDVVALKETGYRVNYFLGDEKSHWQSNVPTAEAVLYKDLYPHINLKVYGVKQKIAYDFVVRPGGDVSDIGLEYREVDTTRLDHQGNLVVTTAFGELKHAKPVAYQKIEGKRVEVQATFKKKSENTYGLAVGQYNKHHPLVIDPLILTYSTYLGGSGWEKGLGVAVDWEGSAYIVGYSEWSLDFPTKNAIQESLAGETDVFIAKVNATGTALVYSTYLGGSRVERGIEIAVDSQGAAYVVGETVSGDFPTRNALQQTFQGWRDAFIAKLEPSGRLEFSSYLGGSLDEAGNGIAVDSEGAVYVAGRTQSQDFPTRKAMQASLSGRGDCFIAKIESTGRAFVYSTFLGGSGYDECTEIALNWKGEVYVTGDTESADFPTRRPIQERFGGETDAFIAKVKASGSALVYSTYFGGSSADLGFGIAVDVEGAAYVTGYTESRDLPTRNPIQGRYGGGPWDAFVAKINSSGSALAYSSYLGGSEWDLAFGVTVDSQGGAYVAGETWSADFPVHDAMQRVYAGESDVFIAKLSRTGEAFIYSTYLGGTDWDLARDVAVHPGGAIYVTGQTKSPDFPGEKRIQGTNAGLGDAFIVKAGIAAAIRIVSWNVLDYPNIDPNLREEALSRLVRILDPDVLVVQEMASSAGVDKFLRDVLNRERPKLYKSSQFFYGSNTDSALFFKKKSVRLVSSGTIPTPFRDVAEYRMKIRKRQGRGVTFNLYSVHFSEGLTAAAEREKEARALRSYLDGLLSDELFVVCGSFNMFASTEEAFRVLTGHQTSDRGRLVDPMHEVGQWHERSAERRIHTESTRRKELGGGKGGGLDDRFDLIFVSQRLEEGGRLRHSEGDYFVFGNDGKHLRRAINKPRNRAVSLEIADALYLASDHLPVVIDLVAQD